MRELPFDLRFALGAHEIHLVHGSPRKVNEFGHTHKPWVHEYGGVQFVNCGSVGR
jgi:predicted phosphodiesterase